MTPTDNRHPHGRYSDDNYPHTAEADDARLQPDPELALSEGKASRTQIIMVALASLIVLGLVLYGITQPDEGSEQVASQPTAATTGSAPSAEQPAQPQDQQNQKPERPAQQPAKPGPSDSARPQ